MSNYAKALRWLAPLMPVTMVLTMQSCFFTGVESTPRIGAKDVVRQGASITPEQQLASCIISTPPSQWISGKSHWLVSDNRFRLATEGVNTVEAGDTLTFDRILPMITAMGDTTTLVRYLRSDGSYVSLPLRVSPDQLSEMPSVTIPFAIDLRMVELADSLLRGRRLYLLTSQQIDLDGTSRTGEKYRQVEVIGVRPGTDVYPLHLVFRMIGSASGNLSGVMMTGGSDFASNRNFDRLFSFTDPHLRYPQISALMWERICNGEVSTGMTRDEARLAAGIPDDVRKGHDGTSYFEHWTYPNGSWIRFVDGLVDSFRR